MSANELEPIEPDVAREMYLDARTDISDARADAQPSASNQQRRIA